MQRAATAPQETFVEYLASRFGTEMLKFIDPEIRLKGLTLEERLKGLSSAELLTELNTKTLSTEERKAYIQALTAILAKLTAPDNNDLPT